jgi:uncharacterized protein (DUF2141 family)
MKMICTKKKWMHSLLSGLAANLMILPVLAQQSSITVNVSGLRSQKGEIIICLWKKEDKNFPICSSTASFQHVTAKATTSNVTATFQNVPPGQYAISAFHDENQDSKLNRGFMGRPNEGLALSNMDLNQGGQGRPSFDKAKFMINGATTFSMSLKYF